MQKIDFIGSLERNNEVTVLFFITKTEETTFNFLQNAVGVM